MALGIGAGLAISGAASALGGLLGNKKKSVSQVPLETVEQKEARKALETFGRTGRVGTVKAGENLGIEYGLSDIEQSGLSSLQDLLNSALPSELEMTGGYLNDLFDTSPDAIDAQFNPFKSRVQREIRDAQDELKRSASFGGNLYSTSTIQDLGDVGARGNELLTEKLVQLVNDKENRRLAAVPLAFQAAQLQEALPLQRIQASQQLGGLERLIQQINDAELLRRRGEQFKQLDAYSTVAGTPSQFGVPSVSVAQESPLQGLLNYAGNLGGQIVGNQLFLDQLKAFKGVA